MTTAAVILRSPQQARPLTVGARWSIGGLGGALCALAVALVVTGSDSDPVDRAVVEALIVGVPIAVGLWATGLPANVRFGALLIGAGVIWSLTALAYSSHSLPYSIGRVAAWLVFPVLMYLMLAYPDGRLTRNDRRLYGSLTLLITVLFIGSALFVEGYPANTPWGVCGPDCPPNAFLVLDSEPAFMTDVVQPLRELLAIFVLTGFAGSLVRRWRAATALRRRLIGPVLFASLAFIGTLAAYLATRRVDTDAAAVGTLGTLWSLCLPAMAAAFGAGLLWRRVAVGDVLARLTAALGDDVDDGRLRTALAGALGDPTLDVVHPGRAPDGWRDAAAARGQAVTDVADDGAPLVALVHDGALAADQELLDAVGSAVRAALRHRRLTARLEESRKRIARSADLERARIERDLHDGAQQRLIALRLKLVVAQELIATDPAGANAALDELGDDVERALEEVRSLGQGVYPSLLSDRGLVDALRGAIAASPTPVHFEATGLTRQSKEVETAVFFACREAIQNATKHAPGASGVWVTLSQNDALRFEVRDDGPGFARPGIGGDGGLRNMRDRIEALGGRLTVETEPGRGTRVRGVIPLR
jgi:signal transduction histidine kinase